MILSSRFVIIKCLILISFKTSNSHINYFSPPSYHNFGLDSFPSVYDTEKPQSCYKEPGDAQRCDPPFENVAYRRPIEATNTCGSNGPTEFCIQTSRYNQGPRQSCFLCKENEHAPHYLNDFNDNNTQTWWQSQTMLDGIEYPKEVNITLHLGTYLN